MVDDRSTVVDRMTAPTVTDEERTSIEEAIAAALLLLYRGNAQQSLGRLGVDEAITLPDDVLAAIAAEAKTSAVKVQEGINLRLQAALDTAAATGADPEAALRTAIVEINDYNTKTLIPYFRSWAQHRALIRAYRTTPDPSDPSRSRAQATQWTWVQLSDLDDECGDAANASPSTLDDLLSIAGGPPPLHRNCMCSLSPGS